MNRFVMAATTLVVLIAFAANSVLGRMALKPSEGELIDPATYTSVRVICGAMVLLLIQRIRRAKAPGESAPLTFISWLLQAGYGAAFMLTLYAVAFSFAYVRLDAAKGTLILFAAVQVTMVSIAAARGERPRPAEILGLLVASGGFTYLLSDSAAQGSASTSEIGRASLLMAVAGIGWGAYSVLGRGSNDPIGDTARNFTKSVPLVLIASLLALLGSSLEVTPRGFVLAAASGGLTSGLGYVLWYTILPHLRTAQAAAVQLSTPIVAAIGGFLFANDPITPRTAISALIILGGIALTVRWRKPAASKVAIDTTTETFPEAKSG